MEKLFFTILRMSVSGSGFFLLGLVLRKLFQRIPKETFYRMWVLLFLSFVIPFRFSAPIQPLISVEEFSDEGKGSTTILELPRVQSDSMSSSIGSEVLKEQTSTLPKKIILLGRRLRNFRK